VELLVARAPDRRRGHPSRAVLAPRLPGSVSIEQGNEKQIRSDV
jgi:hypothetical protein